VTHRDDVADTDRTPLEVMAQAVDAAAADAGVEDLPSQARLWIASAGVFRYGDPAGLIARRHGAADAQCRLTNFGGNLPQAAVAHVAARIQAGELDVGVVLGGEAERNRRLVAADGGHLDSTGGDDDVPAPRFGSESPIPGEVELEVGAGVPAVSYALFESALRAHRGETLAQNEAALGALWAAFSEVARSNPYAWNRAGSDAATIATPSPDNRMVAYPYTKAMCANPQVDMGAAVLLCSVEVARARGIAPDRWVFPQSSATGHDTAALLERHALHTSLAIEPVGRAALDHAGIGVDDIGLVDLYACFPSIVRMTAGALGLGDRPLTVTGGLNFGGGPLNNATLHAIAAMVARLRTDAGSWGLVHGNGGMATKHSIGIYRSAPPSRAFADIDAGAAIEARPRVADHDHVGRGTIVGYTVIHDREGPEAVLAILRTTEGSQTFARSTDTPLMIRAGQEELVGLPARRTDAGQLVLD